MSMRAVQFSALRQAYCIPKCPSAFWHWLRDFRTKVRDDPNLNAGNRMQHGMIGLLISGADVAAIVKRIINGISWSAVHRHLQCLKELIGDGVVSNRWAAQAANHQLRSQPLPPYVANPKLGTQAEWLRREAFRFYSFVVSPSRHASPHHSPGFAHLASPHI